MRVFNDCFAPKDAAQHLYDYDRQALLEDGNREIVKTTPNADGSSTWWLTNKFVYGDRTGRQYVGGVSVDIADRRTVDEALRESEERYRTLLEELADGLFVAQDHQFVFAKAALPEMIGRDPSAFESVPFSSVIAPEDLDLWAERFDARVGAGPEPVRHYSIRLLRMDGQRVEAELSARRIIYGGRPDLWRTSGRARRPARHHRSKEG